MSQKKSKKKNLVIPTGDMLAGIQALTIFYEEELTSYLAIKEQYGEHHEITYAIAQRIDTLSNIINYFTHLTGGQLKTNGEHFN